MKPLSELIHRTPWWALLFGGLVAFLGLAAFVTPYNILDYSRGAGQSEEKRAIKREMDRVFTDSALDLAQNVITGMRNATSDAARREELDHALEQLEDARRDLREAGMAALEARRDAADEVTGAVDEAATAIQEAQRATERALREAGVEAGAVTQSLKESYDAAMKAREEADKAAKADGKRRIVIQYPGHKKPLVDIEVTDGPGTPAPAPPGAPAAPGATVAPAAPGVPALPALPPELRERIHRDVTHDLYRIGVGAGLILILIPLFILTVIAKFFIDRSRAAQRMADLKRKEAEYHRMSRQVTEAKLSALQAQVEPHFLYNTLASVQALTEVDPQRASAMTGHLINYLRNALPKMRGSGSTVGQEVELVRAFLNILQMRMGKRLTFDIAVPPELMELPFPPLMLPSLVENAIKHGLEPQREGGHVAIRAESLDGRLRMIVADTGRGFSETPGAGVGLANIRERLAAMYGERAKLSLEANAPQGVVATIEVPTERIRAAAPAMAGTGTGAIAGEAPAPDASSSTPPTAARRTLAAMGKAERAWRKGLSFAFVGLVALAATLAGLGIVGVTTGLIPVQVGPQAMGGLPGALLGTAGIAVGFAAVVLAIAIVLAVLYGLGFLFVGLAIFIPLVVLVSLVPAASPFILAGLAIWWFVRRRRRNAAAAPAAQ